jgi:hypothetical protein
MAITVKHKFVSAIPDAGDPTIVQPSNWNDTHDLVGTVPVTNGGTGADTLTGYVKGNGTAAMTASATVPSTDITGLGTMSTQNSNNISVTGGSMNGVTISDYVATATKGVANGVASLDGSGTVPISQLPSAVLGALSYQGTWNASTNTPTLTSSVGTKGYYYVVSVAGSTNLNGVTDWQVGDWAVYNGSAWQKVDNTDAVTSVNGYTGTVVLTNTDISGFGTMSTQNANSVAITGGAIDGTTIGATTTSTGKFTTLNASTSLTTPTVQASNSGGLSLKNASGTTQMSMGAGGGDNMSINVSTNLNGTNAQIDISPTGTGHVHINPTGVNSIQINPTYVGTMDNMTIGATTPKAITGTTITATTFSGSGASLTFIPNSALVNSAITINGTSTSLGGSISVGTVTSVTGTSPVVSSGGNTPAISMPAATTSVSGYLTSTDWNTFNGKQAAGTYVNSVSATAPITSSGGVTPTIAIPAATGSVNGYLTSTDWTTFNNKGSGTVTSVTGTAPVVSSGGATPAISMAAATASVNGYLTSTDWTTFNGKYSVGGALGTPSSATLTNATGLPVGGITATGTPSSSTYLRGDGAWATVSASSATNLSGGALGSVPYQLLSGTTVFLAGNTTTTPQFLTSTGVSGVATAPTYTGSTGSGNVVLATSPTLVTPALGTPSAIVLTNATSVPVNQATGTLAVANGGTGVTTSTGSGANVLGTSPTLAGTVTLPSGVANAFGIGLGTAVPSSGIGLSFPATQSASTDANTLDDYEEGTWTPSWNVTGGSWTSSSYTATYTKIGRQVTCALYWVTSAISGTKVNALQGLPFTSANDSNKYTLNIAANQIGLSGAIPVAQVQPNATQAYTQFAYQSTSGWNDLITSGISSSSTLSVTFTYFTA